MVLSFNHMTNEVEVCSKHTKDSLEVHPNIAVFRHPDHKPSGQAVSSEFEASINQFSRNPLRLLDLPRESLRAIYGAHEDVVLFWAHHEKLCLIDGRIAFMGGLDLCFGRWDTNNHPIADFHPKNPDKALFPGQDFNNARIYDFKDVSSPMNNQLDRSQYSRMGWSDLSICLAGPVVDDLKAHFVQRWNFIYNEKYSARRDPRYTALEFMPCQIPEGEYLPNGDNAISTGKSIDAGEDGDTRTTIPASPRGLSRLDFHGGSEMLHRLHRNFPVSRKHVTSERQELSDSIAIQLVRSCTEWSHGVRTENSIANAYIGIIKQSQHFVYIENQFFITATDDSQRPVRNKIGAAIVERILRAHQEGQKYKVIVLMPAVPAFAGDLHADESLGTRAIMEFQYHSICRNGHSIIEKIEKAGIPDAGEYICFYNLRNFDRIQAEGDVDNVELRHGMTYQDSRRGYGRVNDAVHYNMGEGTDARARQQNERYGRHQWAGSQTTGDSNYDSISSCYMDSSVPITSVPWSGSPEAEIQAYVSEDDRIVICGSANLNDRSQLGYHDSEIAVIIEDSTPIHSSMNGKPYQASAFASSLRRQLFRKHLGLIPSQDPRKATANFFPVTQSSNDYDWNSPADRLVSDPLADELTELWNRTARTNTHIFSKAFHVVPHDNCTNWKQYEEWYERLFVSPSRNEDRVKIPPKYKYGHLVEEEFPGGVEEAKAWLARVRGTLVEMPLSFMKDEDFAVAGLKLNALTMEIYT